MTSPHSYKEAIELAKKLTKNVEQKLADNDSLTWPFPMAEESEKPVLMIAQALLSMNTELEKTKWELEKSERGRGYTQQALSNADDQTANIILKLQKKDAAAKIIIKKMEESATQERKQLAKAEEVLKYYAGTRCDDGRWVNNAFGSISDKARAYFASKEQTP